MDLTVVVPAELMDTEGHYLYLISSSLNDRVYVGITNKLRKRINNHTKCMRQGVGYGYKSHLYSTAKKHGLDKFTFSLVAVFDTRVDLTKAEVDLIAKYKADGIPVYNMTAGGEGSLGRRPSAETVAKMSGDNHPMYGKTGENSHWYGRTHPSETRAKISKSRLGKYGGENNPNYKYSPEVIASFSSFKAANSATGISDPQYYRIKKAHPHLFNKER